MNNIAIFASGSGSNAENLILFFNDSPNGKITLLLSNNPTAFALERARRLGIPTFTFTRDDLYHTQKVIDRLNEARIDYIVLAGFLWLIPPAVIEAYRGRIVNIHPALLPEYGGKGMYGDHVHRAVIAAGEKESGITIHHVNEHFDKGDIIFQAKVPVSPGDTPEMLAAKIHALEYRYFPAVIDEQLTLL